MRILLSRLAIVNQSRVDAVNFGICCEHKRTDFVKQPAAEKSKGQNKPINRN
jgi:hypothetical protein